MTDPEKPTVTGDSQGLYFAITLLTYLVHKAGGTITASVADLDRFLAGQTTPVSFAFDAEAYTLTARIEAQAKVGGKGS